VFTPVHAAWACPDGTPCVVKRGHGYVCAGDQCGGTASCCQAARPNHCKHGSLPALQRTGSADLSVTAPDHCRFQVSAAPHPVALAADGARVLRLSPDALPAVAGALCTVAPAAPSWQAEHTLGYRPPPSFPSGPSRAPPAP